MSKSRVYQLPTGPEESGEGAEHLEKEEPDGFLLFFNHFDFSLVSKRSKRGGRTRKVILSYTHTHTIGFVTACLAR